MKWKKSEEYRENQITMISILGFTFYIKNYILLKSRVWERTVYTITFYLQCLCVVGYFKRGNATPILDIHNVIEI